MPRNGEHVRQKMQHLWFCFVFWLPPYLKLNFVVVSAANNAKSVDSLKYFYFFFAVHSCIYALNEQG